MPQPPSEKKTIADFLARHVVAIVGMNVRDNENGQRLGVETVHGTGFLMVYRSVPFLLTAGHIVHGLNDALKKPRSRLHVVLIDSMHYNAEHRNSLWLPYENLVRQSVGNNDDIDYGFILPGVNTVECLAANNIIPVVPENWRNPPDGFDRYFLIGVPAEKVEVQTEYKVPRVRRARCAMIEVMPIDEPPEILKKPFPRFYGKLDLTPDETQPETIKDIGGMSGCPIIGVNFIEGRARYWFYAIQSGWDERDTIAACPFKPFAEHMQEQIDSVLDEEA